MVAGGQQEIEKVENETKENLAGLKENPNLEAKTEIEKFEKRQEREISEPLIEEARSKRNQLLEERGLLPMSKADFDQYFASKDFEIRTDLKQGNTGDCYAVAAIHAMSRSPHFEMIVRSSMKKLPDGSWEVKIPLLSKRFQTITITSEELLPQENKNLGKTIKTEGGIAPDLREVLTPVQGKEGLQVLEAAFIKQKFGMVDRLAAEGGWGDKVLLALGGDNFKRVSFNASRYNEETEQLEYLGLANIPNQKYVDDVLENFDPEIHIATAVTKFFDRRTLIAKVAGKLGLSLEGQVKGAYRAEETLKFFVPGHSYSISKVDRQKKIVTLANPWDTSKPIDLTFGQFKKTFCRLEAIRIDNAKLLKNMEAVARVAA